MRNKSKVWGSAGVIGLILFSIASSNVNAAGPICPIYRGRIQAQGSSPRVEISRSWADRNPPTRSEGLEMLDSIWESLSRSQKKERQKAYEDARRYISRATFSGGVPSGTSKSFKDPQRKDRSARIDIEVITGPAFILWRRRGAALNCSREATKLSHKEILVSVH